MPFVAIPLTVKLVVRGTSDSQPVNNILHYKYSTSPQTSTTLAAFLSAWLTAHGNQWLAVHGPNYTLVGLDVTDLASSTGAYSTAAVVGPGNVGTMAGNAITNNAALAMSWRTGLSGRRNRGRTYIGGLSTAAFTNDTANSAFLSALATLATALISQTFTGGFDFGVTSYKDAVTRAITGYVLDAIADSMRRRLPGRGA